jgi:hypothetical protein
LPVEGFESGISVGEVELEFKVVDEEVLLGVAVEFGLSGVNGAFERRCGDGCLAEFMEHEVDGGDIQEGVLPEDWVVAFQDILVIGVPPVSFFPGLINAAGVRIAVALPVRESGAPAVFDGDEVESLLAFAGANSGGPGISAWGAYEGSDEVWCSRRRQEFLGDLIFSGGGLEDFGCGVCRGISGRLSFGEFGRRCLCSGWRENVTWGILESGAGDLVDSERQEQEQEYEERAGADPNVAGERSGLLLIVECSVLKGVE